MHIGIGPNRLLGTKKQSPFHKDTHTLASHTHTHTHTQCMTPPLEESSLTNYKHLNVLITSCFIPLPWIWLQIQRHLSWGNQMSMQVMTAFITLRNQSPAFRSCSSSNVSLPLLLKSRPANLCFASVVRRKKSSWSCMRKGTPSPLGEEVKVKPGKCYTTCVDPPIHTHTHKHYLICTSVSKAVTLHATLLSNDIMVFSGASWTHPDKPTDRKREH